MQGGKYIAIGAQASHVAAELELTGATIHTGGRNSNGIVEVDCRTHRLTSGYESDDVAFVYHPVWYSNINEDQIIASFGQEDMFKSGFWKHHAAVPLKASRS